MIRAAARVLWRVLWRRRNRGNRPMYPRWQISAAPPAAGMVFQQGHGSPFATELCPPFITADDMVTLREAGVCAHLSAGTPAGIPFVCSLDRDHKGLFHEARAGTEVFARWPV